MPAAVGYITKSKPPKEIAKKGMIIVKNREFVVSLIG